MHRSDAPSPPASLPDTPALVDGRGWRAAVGRATPRLVARASAPCARLFGNRHERAFGILNYHRVFPVSCSGPFDKLGAGPRPTWNVPPRVLRAQLGGLLARGYRPWRLRDLLAAHAAGEPVPREAFAVTFDDGYENLLTHAWPVLRELNVPATVFLATGYLDSPERFPFDDWPAEQAACWPAQAWRPLSSGQVAELLADGLVDLGTHTHTHGDFRGRPDALEAELRVSVALLQERFGVDPAPLALPYGVVRLGFAGPDLSNAARRAGVTCCVSTESDLIRPGDDPYTWGRFNIKQEDSADSLAGRLSGWYHFARDAWRGVKRLAARH